MKISTLLAPALLVLASTGVLGQEANYIGAGGCASSNCHGATTPLPESESRILGNEYSIWSVRDKHSQAYTVLGDDRSQRMAEILGVGDPQQAEECLVCHAVGSTSRFISDGVACEACHGPAEKWLGPHTAADSSHANNVSLGMYDTKDLELRAEKCLGCHVGDSDKTVDHRLIAAGHPDLVFELDTFSAAQPMHWRPAEPSPGNSLPQLRALAVGQAMMLNKSMDLLVADSRAEGWPEFVHLECYQCHHDLRRDSWRIQRGYPGRKPGGLILNASRFVVLEAIAAQVAASEASTLRRSFDTLNQLTSGDLTNGAAIEQAARQAGGQASSLAQRFAQHDFTEQEALAVVRALERDAGRLAGYGVNTAEQLTMAVDSIAAARGAQGAQESIQKLYDYLEHPSTYRPADFASQFRVAVGQIN